MKVIIIKQKKIIKFKSHSYDIRIRANKQRFEVKNG